jgi:L-ascorbate metabolism protein UlaG (beta-lactamase superfamily)
MEEQAEIIAFASAFRELSKILREKADGSSLEPLYEEVPDLLRGYVELYYDIHNNPSFRLYESLLYRSRYYKPSLQHFNMYLIDSDERPFILSTPRLAHEKDKLRLDLPFDHEGIDMLFRMQRTAGDYNTIKNVLGISDDQEDQFRNLFTTTPPESYSRYTGPGARIRYFGHACILIETESCCILTDPVISYGYENSISRYTYSDLPDVIDYVVITHNHQDHILFETMLQLRHKIGQIIVPRNGDAGLSDPNLKLMFNNVGFHQVRELGEMEIIKFKDCTITGVPFLGEHSDLNIRTKLCYHVSFGGSSVLLAADSCILEPRLYDHIHDVLGDIDVLFLGMECDGAPLSWLYGPLLPETLEKDKDQSRRLRGSNFKEGIALVDTFEPKEVYVYAMGQEPWLNYIMSLKYTPESNPIVASNKLIQTCRERNIISERLFGEKEILLQETLV